ncbi:MAG: ABC transporter ATP-binding protein [Clostridia bacterium]|nr:ABC transporter ATP-binding protein [Clostridia bacterium]
MKRNKKKDKDRSPLKIRRVLSNNLYVLGVIHRVAPSYLPTYFLWSVGNALLDFFTNVWLLREIVNRYQSGRSVQEVLWMLLLLIALNLLWYMIIDSLPSFIYPKYRQRIVERIEKELFKKASLVELECYENPEFYDKYVKALEGANGKCMDVVYTVDSLIWTLVSLFSTGTLLFFIDPLLMLFGLVPLFFSIVKNKFNKLSKEKKDESRNVERREGYVQRTFYLNEYAKEMRLCGISRLMLKKHRDAENDFRSLCKKYGFKMAVFYLFSNSSSAVTSFAAMLYAAFRTLVTHSMLLGDCLVVFNSIDVVSWNLTRVAGVFTQFREHAMYIEDYRFFVEYQPKLKKNTDGPRVSSDTLTLDNVSFRYTGAEKDSVSDISLSIKPGEKIALVGHNGSGKTTLVKLLLHLYEPRDGSITLGGRDIGDYNSDSYRDAFTVVFQDFKMFSMSVAENVLLRPLRDGDEQTVTEALKKSGAYEKISSLDKGIATTLTREFDDEGVVLSVGEAQKVSLARIFTNGSPFVILDEPSSALDPIAEYKMFENMMEACQDRTLIFISHRLSSAVLADRVFLMENGRIIESGSHSELMKNGGKYAEMFSMQAENYAERNGEVNADVK